MLLATEMSQPLKISTARLNPPKHIPWPGRKALGRDGAQERALALFPPSTFRYGYWKHNMCLKIDYSLKRAGVGEQRNLRRSSAALMVSDRGRSVLRRAADGCPASTGSDVRHLTKASCVQGR